MENQVKKLQEQVHFLVELLTERQLSEFMQFCNNQESE